MREGRWLCGVGSVAVLLIFEVIWKGFTDKGHISKDIREVKEQAVLE